MPLDESGKARRRKLEEQGHTGATNPELDRLNRDLTDGMTDAQLLARCRSGLPDAQARAALRQRGYDA